MMTAERLGFQVGTRNIVSLTGRAGEVVEALSDIEKLMWHAFKKHDASCKFYQTKGKRYKLLWMAGEESSDDVGKEMDGKCC